MLKKNFRILTALVLATALLCVLFPSLAEPETNGEEIRAETIPDAADGEGEGAASPTAAQFGRP